MCQDIKEVNCVAYHITCCRCSELDWKVSKENTVLDWENLILCYIYYSS